MQSDSRSKYGCTIRGGWAEELPPALERVRQDHRAGLELYSNGAERDVAMVKFILPFEEGTVHVIQIFDWSIPIQRYSTKIERDLVLDMLE